MKKLFTLELEHDWKMAAATVSVVLLLVIARYNNFSGSVYLDRFFLFLLIPLFIIIVFFRESPAQCGFRLGDWKAGLALTALVIAVVAPLLWFVARSDATMQVYYHSRYNADLPLNAFLDLIGWEFMFRGWLLFLYARKYGPADALWLQAVPFALAHLGKPQIETLSTIFGGWLFGWVAWRTKSFLWPFLIHYFVYVFTIVVVGGGLG